MLHPFTTCGNLPAPTTHELLTDANVVSTGNSYEGAIAVQEQSEADYAALAMQDEQPSDQEMLMQCAISDVLNYRDRFGAEAADELMAAISDQLFSRKMARLRRAGDAMINSFKQLLADDPNVAPAFVAGVITPADGPNSAA